MHLGGHSGAPIRVSFVIKSTMQNALKKVDARAPFSCQCNHAGTIKDKNGRVLTFVLTLNVLASESGLNR